MPFDPMPIETRPDVFSLEGLVAWLETQDPEKQYDWKDVKGDCLISHYYAAQGVSHDSYSIVFSAHRGGSYSMVCNGRFTDTPGWTYGAALTRARALLAGAQS